MHINKRITTTKNNNFLIYYLFIINNNIATSVAKHNKIHFIPKKKVFCCCCCVHDLLILILYGQVNECPPVLAYTLFFALSSCRLSFAQNPSMTCTPNSSATNITMRFYLTDYADKTLLYDTRCTGIGYLQTLDD